MAEKVQKIMERMAPEARDLELLNIFDAKERTVIMKTRLEYQYKLIRGSLEVYMEYINYEKDILSEIVKRVANNSNGIARRSDVEERILNRIKKLYRNTIEKHPNNFDLAMEHIIFCKKIHDTSVGIYIKNLIARFQTNPEAWVYATAFYLNKDSFDINEAKSIVHKGLALHKNHKELLLQSIKIEVLSTLGMAYGNDEDFNDKEVLCVKKLNIYLDEINKHNQHHEFYLDLLKFLKKYTFMHPVQQKIYQHLYNCHKTKAIVWEKLTVRDISGTPAFLKEDLQNKELLTEDKFNYCAGLLREGLSHVTPEEKERMWTIYFDFLEQQPYDNNYTREQKSNFVTDALEQSMLEGFNFGNHNSVMCFRMNGVNIGSFYGFDQFPNNLDMIDRYLDSAITRDDCELVNQTLLKSMEVLKPNDTIHLWSKAIRYYTIKRGKDEVDQFFKIAIDQHPDISNFMKIKYLKWLLLSKGCAEAMNAYTTFAYKKPYFKELHETMSKIFRNNLEPDYDAWLLVHQNALKQFGEKDVSVWVNYIKYLKYKSIQKKINLKLHIKNGFMTAKTKLPAELFWQFQEQYNRIINSKDDDEVEEIDNN